METEKEVYNHEKLISYLKYVMFFYKDYYKCYHPM